MDSISVSKTSSGVGGSSNDVPTGEGADNSSLGGGQTALEQLAAEPTTTDALHGYNDAPMEQANRRSADEITDEYQVGDDARVSWTPKLPYSAIDNPFTPVSDESGTGVAEARLDNTETDSGQSDFDEFIQSQGVEREPDEGFINEQVAGSVEDLPDHIQNYEPGNAWGNMVDDKGNHLWNQRLPGGYHLTVDEEGGPVHLHQDAHDPLNGPKDTFMHWLREVRPLGNGTLNSETVDNHEDLPQRNPDPTPN